MTRRLLMAAALPLTTLLLAACGTASSGSASSTELSEGALVVYSGRSENLVKPVIEAFEKATGVDVAVRYGTTAEMAAQLIEEGDRSKADVYLSQDAGALQAVENAGLLAALPQATLDRVDPRFRSESGAWVGVSGRARVLTYNTALVPETDLPASVLDLTTPKWKDQVGIAPGNASFQSFVTAMRLALGEERTEQWLKDMVANGVKSFQSNVEIRDAVDAGTITLGLSNHYYLYEKFAEVGAGNVKAANHWFAPGDVGNLVNAAGVGVLAAADQKAPAQQFVDYLLSPETQRYFATETFEYPLVAEVSPAEGLRPLKDVEGPDISLGRLSDVAATQEMLTRVGLV